MSNVLSCFSAIRAPCLIKLHNMKRGEARSLRACIQLLCSTRSSSLNRKYDLHHSNMRQRKIFFEKVLTMSSLPPNSSLFLPAPFVRKHGRRIGKIVTLRSVENGKSYTVKINVAYPRNRPSALFYGGWKAFAVANELVIGDRLLFVLVAQSSFDVFIHRCGGHSAPDPVPVQKMAEVPIDSDQSGLSSESVSLNKPEEPDVTATIKSEEIGVAQVPSVHFYEPVKQEDEKDCIICRIAAMTQHLTMKRLHVFANA